MSVSVNTFASVCTSKFHIHWRIFDWNWCLRLLYFRHIPAPSTHITNATGLPQTCLWLDDDALIGHTWRLNLCVRNRASSIIRLPRFRKQKTNRIHVTCIDPVFFSPRNNKWNNQRCVNVSRTELGRWEYAMPLFTLDAKSKHVCIVYRWPTAFNFCSNWLKI